MISALYSSPLLVSPLSLYLPLPSSRPTPALKRPEVISVGPPLPVCRVPSPVRGARPSGNCSSLPGLRGPLPFWLVRPGGRRNMAAGRIRAASRTLLRLAAPRPRGPERSWTLAFSTAAQSSAGEDCGSTDPPTEPGSFLAEEEALELKALRLQKEVRDLTERYQKALADSEHVRRRTQKFVEDAKIFGIQSFCKDLVEIADILEKATKHSSGEAEPGDQRPTLKKVFEGLSLLQAKLQSVFAKHGLQKMTPIGDKYDPYDHEIVCHIPADGVQPGTVTLVTQDGYKLHGRTIRPAQVGVAVETGLMGSGTRVN
ncbi:grpE protein homolog 2, mitochondrial [Macrotis lagotis]|uniref:grpE protein homolog 2, mitochondrial n=1 Tax=Macrotis lagotis TaxID=92651 RepID=UPI003D687B85